MSLIETLEQFTPSDKGLSGDVSPTWHQGRTVYGGMTAALCLLAAQDLAQDRPLRSAFIGFVGPSSGRISVEAEVLRAGRNASSVRARLGSSLGPGVEALFTFSPNRESALSYPGPEAPAPAPAADAPVIPPAEGAPAFTHNLEFLWAGGTIPFSGGSSPLQRAWVRHRDPASRAHPLALISLADALAPAIASIMAAFAPMSSMTWMLDFMDDHPSTEHGWWLLESRTDFARGGHSTQDMTIWSTSGQCVAKGRQTVTVFA